jgi:hypothetical protein
VHHPRHRRQLRFREGVGQLAGHAVEFGEVRHELARNRVARLARRDQPQHVRCNGKRIAIGHRRERARRAGGKKAGRFQFARLAQGGVGTDHAGIPSPVVPSL